MSKIKVVESFEITDGRAHEIWKRWHAVAAKQQGSWGELLKTKKHAKSLLHGKKIATHGHWAVLRLIKEHNLDWTHWSVARMGRDRRIDVELGIGQYYVISRVHK